jgi:hypothetical protein
MEPYRLYFLNTLSGGIDDRREFAARNDETAVWIAEGMRHSRAMELWHGQSKIHRWEVVRPSHAQPAEMDPVPAIRLH